MKKNPNYFLHNLGSVLFKTSYNNKGFQAFYDLINCINFNLFHK